MAAVAAPAQAPVIQESVATKILRVLGKTPVHLFLAAVGLLWLVPTIGLLVVSILPAGNFDSIGWWKIFSKPSMATWSNYDEIFKNHQITHALVTTLEIAVGGTVLPILVAALAGYAFAWLEFPGRDWLFVGVIALLVVPLQMALIPIFRLYDTLGLYGTVFGLILFHTAFGLPFAIFTQLRSFSANIDIIGPAAFVSLAIPLAVFFAFQRYFVQGLLAGSVK